MSGGRKERVIVIRRRTTVLLWILATILILVLTLTLAGKNYRKVDPVPFRNIRAIAHHVAAGDLTVPTLSALVMPMLLNAMLFLPWGYFLFLALDTPKRLPAQSYVLVIILAMGLSGFIEAWQYFLPTRVTDVDDVIWNVIGAFAGAILGHIRARVRFEYE